YPCHCAPCILPVVPGPPPADSVEAAAVLAAPVTAGLFVAGARPSAVFAATASVAPSTAAPGATTHGNAVAELCWSVARITSSTRRLELRPSAVALSAIGRNSP